VVKLVSAKVIFKTSDINKGFAKLEGEIVGIVQVALEEAASQAALVYIFPLIPERSSRLETSAQKQFLGVGAGTAAVMISYAATDPSDGFGYAELQETDYPHKNTSQKPRAQMLFLTEGIATYGSTQYISDISRNISYIL